MLAICVALSTSSFSQGIAFEEVTWQDALAKAKTENKLLFVDAYAKWCGPCKRMAKYEFTKEAVGDYYNANFVNLKLDMETPNGRTFDAEYPVSAYPTMFFLDGDGKIVKKIKGGQKGEVLIQLAKQAMGSHDFSGDWRKKYDDGDRTYETVYNYVKTLNQSNKQSLKIANDYLESDPKLTKEERLAFIAEAAVEADSKIFEELAANKSAAIKLLGNDVYDSKIRAACDNTVAKAIEYEYPDLLTEAKTKAEENLTTGAKEYGYTADIKYALEMRDMPTYLSAVQSLSKLYLKNDVEAMKPLLNQLMNNKVKSEKLTKLSIDLAKKYDKKSKSSDSGMMYARSLAMTKDFKKAVEVLDKAIKNVEKDGGNTSNLQNFKKIMEQKINS